MLSLSRASHFGYRFFEPQPCPLKLGAPESPPPPHNASHATVQLSTARWPSRCWLTWEDRSNHAARPASVPDPFGGLVGLAGVRVCVVHGVVTTARGSRHLCQVQCNVGTGSRYGWTKSTSGPVARWLIHLPLVIWMSLSHVVLCGVRPTHLRRRSRRLRGRGRLGITWFPEICRGF